MICERGDGDLIFTEVKWALGHQREVWEGDAIAFCGLEGDGESELLQELMGPGAVGDEDILGGKFTLIGDDALDAPVLVDQLKGLGMGVNTAAAGLDAIRQSGDKLRWV